LGVPLKRILAAVFAAAALLSTPSNAAEEPKPKPATTLDELDKRLAEAFAKGKIPGASVTIVEGNQIVFTKGYGYADLKTKKPVTPETVFRAGSISKSFTSIGVMMLVEEGKLSLDTKLADLMPELKFDNAWEKTDPIRLVHLLEHTTGFDDIGFHHYFLAGKDVPLSKAVELYGPYKSRWKPGSMMSYCNAGPVIAGRIIEKVSGQTFQEFIASRLSGPLAMESAYWTLEPQITDRMSKSYSDTEGTEEPFVEILARPSGSLNITSKDLAKLSLLMLGRGTLDGRTYLSTASIERIERPETTDGARAGLKYGYGLGNIIYAGKKAIFFGHDGGIDGFVSKLEYAPAHGAGFVVMANLGAAEVQDASTAIKDYLERSLPDAKPVAVPIPAADLQDWAGFYQSITPRQQNLAILPSIFAWQIAKAENGEFVFNDTKRTHLGGAIFQRADRAAPNMIFVRQGGDVLLFTGTGADRKVPLWEVGGKAAYAVALALAVIATVVYMLIWIPSAFLGRLSARGGVTIRLVPWLAMLSLLGLAGVTLYILSTGDLDLLGKPSNLGWTVYGLSLAVPAMGALALLRAMMGSSANLFVRSLAWLNGLVVLAFAAYMYAYGWIGMKLWE
jgi:CubicO group peptidase (beta-lactamase class C family)